MGIRFSVDREVQVVHLSDALSDAEAGAIQFKLEEKFNQGRTRVVFELAKFDIQSAESRNRVGRMIEYCLNRNVLAACAGLEASHWPLIKAVSSKTF